MQSFTTLTVRAAPLDIDNLDTDQIIPKQFLKTTERAGLGKGLFYDLRYDEAGAKRPGFVLDDPSYAGAGILIAGANFGCGSSREHAPWALMDFGIRCVIAEGFADIFYNNCFQNGLLPIALPAEAVESVMEEARGGNHVFTVDLAAQTISTPSGRTIDFDIDPGRKAKLLQGLDAIGETLRKASSIEDFEARRSLQEPWMS
ncbi:MAG TPA: 3-isopropylmalate dehydratase small subunit [Caulobacteraceae bacterium]|jgi:3-isopropylmalate dehydratase/3-isopropylmalate/(R)-2-methylmalate dehydratase small subunit